jgi:adenylate cyclase
LGAEDKPEKARQGPRKSAGGFLSAILPGLILTLLLLVVHSLRPALITQLGDLIFDAYQRAHPRPYQDVPVRVVDIDDETLARLGQWPWPRTDMARLIQTLANAGAASIAMDIVFSEPDRTSPSRIAAILRQNPQPKINYNDIANLPDHDVLFGKTLAATPSVTGYFLQHEPNKVRPPQKAGFAVSGDSPIAATPSFQGAIVPLPVINNGAAGTGFVSLVGQADSDGIVRTAPLLAHIGDEMLPSLSVEALRVAQGAGGLVVKSTTGSGELGGGMPRVVALKIGNFEIPTTPRGEMWMYYTAPHPARSVPAWKILTGALSDAQLKQLFQGRIVFIGTGAAGLRDLVSTPIAPRELGVVVHAEIVEQAILGKFLTRPDWAVGLERAILLLLCMSVTLLLPRLGALRGGIVAAIAFVAAIGGSWAAFRYGAMLLDPTYPAGGVVLVYIAGTGFSFYREERARAYIRRAFDRYLSPELVERIARDPGQLELGGEVRDMTVMFCDIRSFSRISEKFTAHQIIQFLIKFLTPMTDVLLAQKATIDKYIGDAILAFWNAPLDDPDHARNAVLGALGMVEKLKALNAEHEGDPGWPGEVKIGIGINSGPCCVGNIGSSQRLNYSLIGDTVNLASRIEGLTKIYGVAIALGQTLAEKLPEYPLIELDLVRVVGRDAPERLYALTGGPEIKATPDFSALAAAQEAMLKAYRAQDWDGAAAALEKLSPMAARFGYDKLVQLYAGRIAVCRKSPPGAGWDGVFQATEK